MFYFWTFSYTLRNACLMIYTRLMVLNLPPVYEPSLFELINDRPILAFKHTTLRMSKQPLLSLPVAATLPQFLQSDSVIKSPQALFKLSKYSAKEDEPLPSMLRRSRQLGKTHFSYTSPMPVEFPYRIPEGLAKELMKAGDNQVDIESLLARIEPDLDHPVFPDATPLNAYTSPTRLKLVSKARLLGLSQACLDDMLPNLDVGDAFEAIASGSEPDAKAQQLARSAVRTSSVDE